MIGIYSNSALGIKILNGLAAVAGAFIVLLIENPRVGTIIFLGITAVESGIFTAVYGLQSSWRQVPAARAVFWVVMAYCGLATHLLTMYLFSERWWWTDDLREILYLGLAVSGLNLVLTLRHVLHPEPDKR